MNTRWMPPEVAALAARLEVLESEVGHAHGAEAVAEARKLAQTTPISYEHALNRVALRMEREAAGMARLPSRLDWHDCLRLIEDAGRPYRQQFDAVCQDVLAMGWRPDQCTISQCTEGNTRTETFVVVYAIVNGKLQGHKVCDLTTAIDVTPPGVRFGFVFHGWPPAPPQE